MRGPGRCYCSDRVRADVGRMPGKAGKEGYALSPELSLKQTYIFSSTFEGSSHLERPERRFFRNLHFWVEPKGEAHCPADALGIPAGTLKVTRRAPGKVPDIPVDTSSGTSCRRVGGVGQRVLDPSRVRFGSL